MRSQQTRLLLRKPFANSNPTHFQIVKAITPCSHDLTDGAATSSRWMHLGFETGHLVLHKQSLKSVAVIYVIHALYNYIVLRCTALQCATLRYVTLHYITFHWIALDSIRLHHISKHFKTFHYSTVPLRKLTSPNVT